MMRIRVGISVLFALSVCAVAALAETTGIYAVRNVTLNDSLNVREGPGVDFYVSIREIR